MSDQPRPEPFDVRTCDKLRGVFLEIFAAHPEVRSLACSIDWVGPLNRAEVMHGVWLGQSGAVSAADAVHGSIEQTLRMLETQFARAVKLNQHLREECAALGKELVEKHAESQRASEELAALRAGKEEALAEQRVQSERDEMRRLDL